MIKNNKGFALTEILILSTVVIGVLTFMYVQFKNINRGYQYSFKYDTVEGMYLANNVLNYINKDNYDKLVDIVSNDSKGYIDITECDFEVFNTPNYCDALFEKSEINKIIFTEENLEKLKNNMLYFDNDFKNYIQQIKTTNSTNDYRIIIKYNNGTFCTMRFNKGNAYVKDGLIAYLDGINNTGSGHSNNTNTWKDLSGNNNDAILYNSPIWSNNSIKFDGQTNYGLLTNTSNQQFVNGFTLETRVKILSLKGINQENTIALLGNWENGGGGINYNNSNKIESMVHTGEYKSITSSIDTILEDTHTLTLIYNNKTQTLYIDGIIVATETYNSELPITSTTAPFGIGCNPTANNTTVDYYANVEFENILIYDRALTENEVLRNYQADIARY